MNNGAIKTKANYKLIFIRRFFSRLIIWTRHGFQGGRFNYKAIPQLNIETTSVCLSNCVFCAYQHIRRPKQHMEREIFQRAVDEYVQMGGVELNLCTVLGEPTCDPHLLERIRYIKKYPQIQKIGFISTLQNLHQFNIEEFVSSGITNLEVSITLSGKEKYLEFFGVDLYGQALKNLTSLLTENKKKKNIINLFINIKPTNEPIEDMINHPDFKLVNSLACQDLIETAKKNFYFVDDWCNAVKLPAYLKKRPLYPRFFRPCALMINSAVVFSNGNLGICPCRDYNADSELILGNIKQASLRELLQGQKRFKLIFQWRRLNRIPKICNKCAHYVY